MKLVNSISGGKTSGYMAIHYPADVNIFACVCIDHPDATPKDRAILKYCQDKLQGNFIASAESVKTLKIVMQLEQLLGKEIIWVRGKSFDEVVNNAGCLPTWNRRFCTTEMKIYPMFEYLYPRHGVVETNIGFRFDEFTRGYSIKNGIKEIRRISKIDYPVSCKNYGQRKQNWVKDFVYQYKKYPLIEDQVVHLEIQSFWKKQHPEFIFPNDSNCQGCHHKPPEIIKKNYIDEPAILDWFAKQEEKKQKYGKSKYYTWHDTGVMYRKVFDMNFTGEFDFDDFTMCNSGGCTD